MSFCLARGVVKCVRPLWTTLPMEDGDEVPETIELPPAIFLPQDMVFKKHHSGIGAGIPESTLEETASELREGLPGKISRGEEEPGRQAALLAPQYLAFP